MDAQIQIVMKRAPVPVDLSVLPKISSLGQALTKCMDAAGLNDKALCIEAGIDNGVWSRMKANGAGVTGKQLRTIMDVCGNEIPLMWLNWSAGREPLPPLRETELEREVRELRDQLAEARRDQDTITRFLRDAGRLPA